MSTAFPFRFVNVGNPVPFTIEANPDFPTETEPLCILNNLGTAPAPDTFPYDRRRRCSERSGPLGADFPLGNGRRGRCRCLAVGCVS